MNGIYHGDISFSNLTYDTSGTDDHVGIVNDFDLASRADHPTTNDDRTGTIPFMAIDLLDGGFEDQIPRLYRHDMESFVWVLAYITVADIEYEDHTIKISPQLRVKTWFKDDSEYRDAHILSKRRFHEEYGRRQPVFYGYYHYHNVVRQMIRHWANFHQSLWDTKYTIRPAYHISELVEEPVPNKTETDDPTGSLKKFIATVEASLSGGGTDGGEGFAEVKTLLFEAIETPGTLKAV